VILLVEDHPDSADVFTRMLKTRGQYVLAVRTAADALRVLESVLPHVLVLDLGLPDKDGLELLRQIRTEPQFAMIRVVIFSADPTLKSLQQAKALGVEHFFVKGTAKWETVCDAVVEMVSLPRASGVPPLSSGDEPNSAKHA